jgi:hypothetical protein
MCEIRVTHTGNVTIYGKSGETILNVILPKGRVHVEGIMDVLLRGGLKAEDADRVREALKANASEDGVIDHDTAVKVIVGAIRK